MQQITLTEYTESYAVSVEDGLPENEAVFFKTKDGRTFEGEYHPETFRDLSYFESKQGEIVDPEDVISWHPVTVDM